MIPCFVHVSRKINRSDIMNLLIYCNSIMNIYFSFTRVLLLTVMAPHNDRLMHPVHGIELRTVIKCFKN
jgi:hypothetical protein